MIKNKNKNKLLRSLLLASSAAIGTVAGIQMASGSPLILRANNGAAVIPGVNGGAGTNIDVLPDGGGAAAALALPGADGDARVGDSFAGKISALGAKEMARIFYAHNNANANGITISTNFMDELALGNIGGNHGDGLFHKFNAGAPNAKATYADARNSIFANFSDVGARFTADGATRENEKKFINQIRGFKGALSLVGGRPNDAANNDKAPSAWDAANVQNLDANNKTAFTDDNDAVVFGEIYGRRPNLAPADQHKSYIVSHTFSGNNGQAVYLTGNGDKFGTVHSRLHLTHNAGKANNVFLLGEGAHGDGPTTYYLATSSAHNGINAGSRFVSYGKDVTLNIASANADAVDAAQAQAADKAFQRVVVRPFSGGEESADQKFNLTLYGRSNADDLAGATTLARVAVADAANAATAAAITLTAKGQSAGITFDIANDDSKITSATLGFIRADDGSNGLANALYLQPYNMDVANANKGNTVLKSATGIDFTVKTVGTVSTNAAAATAALHEKPTMTAGAIIVGNQANLADYKNTTEAIEFNQQGSVKIIVDAQKDVNVVLGGTKLRGMNDAGNLANTLRPSLVKIDGTTASELQIKSGNFIALTTDLGNAGKYLQLTSVSQRSRLNNRAATGLNANDIAGGVGGESNKHSVITFSGADAAYVFAPHAAIDAADFNAGKAKTDTGIVYKIADGAGVEEKIKGQVFKTDKDKEGTIWVSAVGLKNDHKTHANTKNFTLSIVEGTQIGDKDKALASIKLSGLSDADEDNVRAVTLQLSGKADASAEKTSDLYFTQFDLDAGNLHTNNATKFYGHTLEVAPTIAAGAKDYTYNLPVTSIGFADTSVRKAFAQLKITGSQDAALNINIGDGTAASHLVLSGRKSDTTSFSTGENAGGPLINAIKARAAILVDGKVNYVHKFTTGSQVSVDNAIVVGKNSTVKLISDKETDMKFFASTGINNAAAAAAVTDLHLIAAFYGNDDANDAQKISIETKGIVSFASAGDNAIVEFASTKGTSDFDITAGKLDAQKLLIDNAIHRAAAAPGVNPAGKESFTIKITGDKNYTNKIGGFNLSSLKNGANTLTTYANFELNGGSLMFYKDSTIKSTAGAEAIAKFYRDSFDKAVKVDFSNKKLDIIDGATLDLKNSNLHNVKLAFKSTTADQKSKLKLTGTKDIKMEDIATNNFEAMPYLSNNVGYIETNNDPEVNIEIDGAYRLTVKNKDVKLTDGAINSIFNEVTYKSNDSTLVAEVGIGFKKHTFAGSSTGTALPALDQSKFDTDIKTKLEKEINSLTDVQDANAKITINSDKSVNIVVEAKNKSTATGANAIDAAVKKVFKDGEYSNKVAVNVNLKKDGGTGVDLTKNNQFTAGTSGSSGAVDKARLVFTARNRDAANMTVAAADVTATDVALPKGLDIYLDKGVEFDFNAAGDEFADTKIMGFKDGKNKFTWNSEKKLGGIGENIATVEYKVSRNGSNALNAEYLADENSKHIINLDDIIVTFDLGDVNVKGREFNFATKSNELTFNGSDKTKFEKTKFSTVNDAQGEVVINKGELIDTMFGADTKLLEAVNLTEVKHTMTGGTTYYAKSTKYAKSDLDVSSDSSTKGGFEFTEGKMKLSAKLIADVNSKFAFAKSEYIYAPSGLLDLSAIASKDNLSISDIKVSPSAALKTGDHTLIQYSKDFSDYKDALVFTKGAAGNVLNKYSVDSKTENNLRLLCLHVSRAGNDEVIKNLDKLIEDKKLDAKNLTTSNKLLYSRVVSQLQLELGDVEVSEQQAKNALTAAMSKDITDPTSSKTEAMTPGLVADTSADRIDDIASQFADATAISSSADSQVQIYFKAGYDFGRSWKKTLEQDTQTLDMAQYTDAHIGHFTGGLDADTVRMAATISIAGINAYRDSGDEKIYETSEYGIGATVLWEANRVLSLGVSLDHSQKNEGKVVVQKSKESGADSYKELDTELKGLASLGSSTIGGLTAILNVNDSFKIGTGISLAYRSEYSDTFDAGTAKVTQKAEEVTYGKVRLNAHFTPAMINIMDDAEMRFRIGAGAALSIGNNDVIKTTYSDEQDQDKKSESSITRKGDMVELFARVGAEVKTSNGMIFDVHVKGTSDHKFKNKGFQAGFSIGYDS